VSIAFGVSLRGCRQFLRLAAGLCAILLLSATLFAQLPRPVSTPVGPEHDDPLARELWFQRGRIVPGKPGAAAQFLRRAYQKKMQLRAARLKISGSAMTAYSGALTTATPSSSSTTSYGGWVPLGPAPINSNSTGSLDEQDYGPVVGRATSVVVDPGDPTGNTVYLGGAYGGVWKSTNAAAADPSAVTWTPLTDQQATLATGSLALQPSSSGPSSVILVGTGEADFSIDSYYGLGILRSADGGNTWTQINSGGSVLSGLAFAKIAFSTDNPNLVVAAATGAGNDEGATNAGGGNSPGLFTSSDGGQTWAQTKFEVVRGIGATSVIYDSAAHKFFAFLQFDGYYTSKDGMTWTRLTSQPGTALHNCPIGDTGVPVCNVFRGEMAVVPGREELYTWYVTIDDQGNIGDGGIYKTTNGGSTWQQVSDTGITNCGDGANNGCGTEQGWFNLTLAAVPNGSGTDLYAGAVNLYKCSITAANSLCATKPFINLTHVYGCAPIGSLAHVHPDQHGMGFLPLSPSQVVMYFANDGGIYRALNGYALKSGTCGAAANPFQNLNGTMGSMAQFVDFSNSPTDVSTLLGGTQDNGSPATDATYGSRWISVNAGDGGYNAMDPISGNWFTSNTDVSVQRCGAGINCLAQTFDPVVTNSTVGGDHGYFYTPFILDPQATSRMMVGTCRLWRGNSDGSGFSPLSYNFDTVLNQIPNQACSGNETQLIRSIAAGGPNTGNGSSVIYVGTEGGFDPLSQNPVSGRIWVTNDADLGAFTWSSINGSNSPYAISGVAVDPNDPTGNSAYAVVTGFGSGHVLQTTDQGLSWHPLGAQLPDAPVNAIVIDPDDSGTIYAATDVGVFVTHDLQTWVELGQLPNVAVLQLHMFESGGVKQLRAGTYGRGVWSYDIPYQIRVTTPDVHLFPGQSGTINGIITAYNGYSSSVDIQCPANVTFGTCTGATVTPIPSGTPFSLSVTAGTNAASSDYSFTIQSTGTDSNATVETAPAVVSVVDYTLFFSLPTVTVNQGATADGGGISAFAFYEPVTLSCSNLPPGATCNFYPSTMPSFDNQGALLTLAAGASTPVGTYNVTINASASGQPSPKTATFSLTVGSSPDYSMTVTPPIGAVPLGGSVPLQITLTPAGGYAGPVTLSCSAFGYITCSFSPSSTVTLANSPVSISSTVSVGLQQWVYLSTPSLTLVRFIGTGPGTANHDVAVNVPIMDFSLLPRQPAAAVIAGQAGQYELFVNSVAAPFTNPVSFSCSGLPAGAACSFSPATVTPNNSQAIVVLSVTTPKTLAALRSPATPTQAQLMLALLLPGTVIAISGSVRSRKNVFVALLIVVLALVILMPACGGGGSSSGPPPPPPPTTTPSSPPPPASYNFTVTATSGTVQHQLPLTLVVQGK
jgi:photosystem II stability/assembly factor-like uncharacterized protein